MGILKFIYQILLTSQFDRHCAGGFPGGSEGKASACNAGRPRFNPWVGKIPWRRKWLPTPVILAWRAPWMEKPGRLQSMGSQRVGHD